MKKIPPKWGVILFTCNLSVWLYAVYLLHHDVSMASINIFVVFPYQVVYAIVYFTLLKRVGIDVNKDENKDAEDDEEDEDDDDDEDEN